MKTRPEREVYLRHCQESPIWGMAQKFKDDPQRLRMAFNEMSDTDFAALVEEVNYHGGPLRALGLLILGKSGDARALDVLLARLTRDVPESHHLLSRDWRYSITRRLLPWLRQMEHDTRELERVLDRQQTALSLGELGDSRAADALRPLLGDRDERVRTAAQHAIVRLRI
jgi:HEAT repeat protein